MSTNHKYVLTVHAQHGEPERQIRFVWRVDTETREQALARAARRMGFTGRSWFERNWHTHHGVVVCKPERRRGTGVTEVTYVATCFRTPWRIE